MTIIAIVLLVKNRKSDLFHVIPKKDIIYFQSFRIVVELVILATFLDGVFPIETTFEGYNYEIVIGLIAPVIAYGVYRKNWFPEFVVVLFNITGLITLSIIIFIVITSLYFPSVWGDNVPVINERFSHMPYLLLPGFLAPVAIFAHVFSLMQIRKTKGKN